MQYQGRVQDGVVVLSNGIALPEGTEVSVVPVTEPASENATQECSSLYERLKPLIGTAEGLPADASKNVDHYLYGHPKQ